MRAVILAAGRGRRLGQEDGQEPLPKCLLELGGKTLLERMLASLRAVGVAEATLVVGYREDVLRAAAEGIDAGARPALGFVSNPAFTRGSLLSLERVTSCLGRDDLLLLDADVLFPTALLERLVRSAHPSAFLLDPRSSASGEEMMLLARAGRVLSISRRLTPEPGDQLGEGVGFLKLRRDDQAPLLAAVAELIAAGQLDADYEQAIDRALARIEVGYERVDDLPWTEIDFPEDVARARDEVLPAIEELER